MNKKKKGNFRRFLKYYKPHMGLFILDIFFVIILSAASLIFPLIIQQIIKMTQESTINNKDFLTIIIIASGIVGVRMIAQFVIGYWGHVMGTNIEYDMRVELYNHIQNLPTKYFDQHESGKIIQRIIGDLRDVTEFAHHGPEDILISILTGVGAFAILFPLHWKLAVVLLIAIFVCMSVLILFRKRLRKVFKKNKVTQGELTAAIANSIQGIRETKAFANEDFENERFQKKAKSFQRSWRNTYKNLGAFQSISMTMVNITTMSVPIVGVIFLMEGNLDIATFVAFTLYASYATQPIFKMVQFMEQLQRGMSGIDRFFAIIDEQAIEDLGNEEIKNVKGEIEFKDVTFAYDEMEHPVLKKFNLKIKQGEKVAIVGPTGVGKTTITSLVPRFYEIDDGEILLDGVNINKLKLNNLRKNIGIVQQKPFMFIGSIKDNIMYGKLDATEEEVIAAAKKAKIHDFVMTLNDKYDSKVGEQGVKLSGGQRQRISLARIFISNPKILILDEATSALDNKTEIEVQQALEKLMDGCTSITVAHRLSTIINSDRIILLGPEGIVEEGTHKELIKLDGVYASLFNSKLLETQD